MRSRSTQLGLILALLAAALAGQAAAAPLKGGLLMKRSGPTSAPRGVNRADTPSPPTCNKATCTKSDFTMSYFGGQVISNVKVYAVSWTSAVDSSITSLLPGFYTAITNSDWLDAKFEWNTVGVTVAPGTTGNPSPSNQLIGRGTFAGAYVITPGAANQGRPCAGDATQTCLTDRNIQNELSAQIDAHLLPAPDANTIYMTYFPPKTVIDQGGTLSCAQNSFCAYHSTFKRTTGTPQEFYYGVMPDFGTGSGCDSGCGNGTQFENVCSASSHELAEAVSDAEVGLVTSNSYDFPAAWANNTSLEIGDMCNQLEGAVVAFDNTSYVVQKTYSDLSDANGIVGDPAQTPGECVTTLFAPRDFHLFANPNTAVVAPGGASVDLPLKLETTNGAAQGTISLSAKLLLPSAELTHYTLSFDNSTVTSDSTPVLTIAADAGAAPQSDVVLVVEADGLTTRTASVLVQVGTNLFSMAVAPATQAITAGGATVDYTVTTTSVSGTAELVTLSGTFPAGLSATFTPATVTAGGTSTLTLTADATAVNGLTGFTVTGTTASSSATASASATVSGGVNVVVNTFTIAVQPFPAFLAPTGTVALTVDTTINTGTAEAITLTLDPNNPLPSTITGAFNPPTILTGQSSTLTLTSTGASPTGDYFYTVVGTAASDLETVDGEVIIDPNDFTLTVAPTTQGIAPNGQGTYSLTTAVKSGAAQPLTFDASGLPAGVTVDGNNSVLSANTGDPASLILLVDAGAAPGGPFPFTITATDGLLVQTAAASITILSSGVANDFSLSLSPGTRTVGPNSSTTYTVTASIVAGTGELVTLTLDPATLPNGVTAAFNPASITAGGGTSTLTLTTDGTVGPSTGDPITVTGTSPSVARTGTASLDIVIAAPGNDFSLTAAPGTATLVASGTVSFTVTTAQTAGTAERIALSVTGMPAGVTAAFSPASITAGASSTLTLTASSSVAASTGNSLTIVGTATSATHSAPVSLDVTAGSGVAPPTVQIMSPASGATVSGTVSVTAAAAAGAGTTLSKIDLYVDSTRLGSANGSPGTVSWDTTLIANGTHSLTAKAFDALGQNTTSAAVAVTVNNSSGSGGLAVSVSAPLDGATVSGTVTMSAAATGGTATSLSLFVDAVKVATAASSPETFQWDSTTVANGSHAITAQATDASGRTASSTSVTVTVQNGSDASSVKSGGCSSSGGGSELFSLFGLAGYLRLLARRRRAAA